MSVNEIVCKACKLDATLGWGQKYKSNDTWCWWGEKMAFSENYPNCRWLGTVRDFVSPAGPCARCASHRVSSWLSLYVFCAAGGMFVSSMLLRWNSAWWIFLPLENTPAAWNTRGPFHTTVGVPFQPVLLSLSLLHSYLTPFRLSHAHYGASHYSSYPITSRILLTPLPPYP